MKMLHIARQVVARYLTAAKPPSKSQLDYLDHLLKQQKVPRPDDYDKLTMSDVSVLIDGLKKKRGKPVWYGNGQFSHWEKDAKLSPQQRGWERRKEQDERALNNIPPEHMHAWHTLKKLFKGTPDERAEQFMEYLEEHPGESDVWLQENADKEVAKATREWERKQRERAKLEKDCDKKQTLYENAWYKEQERATQEKNKLKQLKEKADGVCEVIENEYERVPFAASMAARVASDDQEDLTELKDTMQALVRSGTHPSFSFTYKKIEGRSVLSLARIKALVKKYPKVIAGWFGGTDLDYTEGSMGGGSVLDEPFKQPRVRRPQRYSPASFTVIRRASLAARVAAKYKSKKKVKTQDGDDITIYEYSDRQVANRNRYKAEQIAKLEKAMGSLRSKVQKDLKSSDPETALTALAVGLMDHTYERVGNTGSAKEGHYGVTGWLKKHVTLGKDKVTVQYIGKSGVEQEKYVTDASLIKALRKAYEDAKADGDCLFCYDGGTVDASKVNEYLKPFGVTAKDIRGLHANREMRERLTAERKGKLPDDPKEREKQLKDEFKKALEGTAEAVGHEAATLRSQYLVPGLEEDFLKDGKVSKL